MEDSIGTLEIKIKSLIQECENLKASNLKLRQAKAMLMRDKELLLAKNKAAISQIEMMVTRLKSIEEPQ